MKAEEQHMPRRVASRPLVYTRNTYSMIEFEQQQLLMLESNSPSSTTKAYNEGRIRAALLSFMISLIGQATST